MSLTLEVIGEKASRMGRAARKTFTGGGTIGRLGDNDWVFPDEYISGHHAKILFANGAFLIEDTSTNGVFINSQQNRLPRHKPHPLRSGDTIFIDDYEVRVTLEQDPVALDSYGPESSNGSRGSLIPDDSFFEGALGPEGAPSTVDPLALLGLQSAPSAVPGPTAASLQNASPLAQHYRPPSPLAPSPQPVPPLRQAAPPGFIPDDYDPMGAEKDPFASDPFESESGPMAPPARRPAPLPSRVAQQATPPPRAAAGPVRPAGQAPSAAAATVMTGPPRIPRPGSRPPPPEARADTPPSKPDRDSGRGVQPASFDPFAEVAAAVPKQSRAPSAAKTAPPPSSVDSTTKRPALWESQVTDGATGDLDFAALLAGAGIDSVRVTPELSQQFGMILRVVVAGLMDVLRARDKIKDEFRMRMTTFKTEDNNPLKFSANVEDALHNLLVKRNAAYLGPVEAFEDAFLDVRNHQMAMLAGMRVAYEAMLAEFEPDRLQKELDPQAKGGNFLSGGAKAKYWELYRTRFHDMVKDADSSFRHLFGDVFAKAYEEQLARLRASNRAGRNKPTDMG